MRETFDELFVGDIKLYLAITGFAVNTVPLL